MEHKHSHPRQDPDSEASATGHTGEPSPLATPRSSDEHAGHKKPGTPMVHDRKGVQGVHAQHAGHEGHRAPGRGAEAVHAHPDHTGHEQTFRRRFWISLILSIPVLVYSPAIQGWLGFTMPAFPGSDWIGPVFAVAIFGYGGLPFLRMAIPELQNRQPGMMMLISLAISVAFIYSLLATFSGTGMGFYWELVTLIDIMLLGHWIEMRSVRQASGALDQLARLMPDTAERIIPGEDTEVIPVTKLNIGDRVLVRPGAGIPADGVVDEGRSEVNEAMITGESRPIPKEPGDRVIAGTINGEGSLRVRVTAVGEGTALAGIMRLVLQAQLSKSHTQLLADRAAGWLFYVALGLALITAAAWTLSVGFNQIVIERVATVLVIACPHALGLAVPLVVAITTAIGAGNGVLVRDRAQLELAREIDTVIFDKTGTLTRGEFGVNSIAVDLGWDADRALAIAASIEGDSEHSIAQGIRRSAHEKGLQLLPVSSFEAIKGRGVRASLDGATFYGGGPRLLEMLDAKLPELLADFTRRAEAQGAGLVYLISDGRVVAGFSLADLLRPESKPAVARLHDLGLEVVLLTGDSQAVAEAVAAELGIDQVFAEVLPEDKEKQVAGLQKHGKRVAMVGDGINDAPALARADVGIAIGSGTDVAIESAGIILVKSNPMDVVKVIELSRASYRKMVQNLVWAAGYNVIALPLAAGVLSWAGVILSPAAGALLMSLSTVIVAINAQLLRGVKLGTAAIQSQPS